MSEDLKDILSNLNPEIDQKALLLYLQGKLSAENQHKIEKEILNSEFESDAIDGLSEIKDKQKIKAVVEQLNRDLKKKTEKKKRSRQRLHFKMDNSILFTIILILLLIIISFIIIKIRLAH
jgi:hypothetical protein